MDVTLALYLVMHSPKDKRVLAAWPYCVRAGDTSPEAVSRLASVTTYEARQLTEKLRALGLLDDNGIHDMAKGIIAKEIGGHIGKSKKTP